MSELVPLGDVVEIKGGGTPSRSVAGYWGGPIPWATVKDFKSTSLSETLESITNDGVENSATNIIPAGSIIVPTRMAVGKAAINTIDLAINQDLKALLPASGIDRRFLLYFLLSKSEFLEDRAQGATVKGIKLDLLRSLEFPKLPLSEQQRIANILEKAGGIRRKRERALAMANGFLQTVFLEMFGQSDWPTEPLSRVVSEGTIVTYGIVQAGPEYPNGVPYIRTGDIKNGRIQVEGLKRTAPELAAKFARSTVRAGDVVMSIRATVGTTAVVPLELDGANLTQGTARISPGQCVTLEYLLNFLRSGRCQNWIQKQVKGATFREITLTRLRELEVPLPPIDLQRKFSALAEVIASKISKLDRDCVNAEELFSSLSQRAFRGEL